MSIMAKAARIAKPGMFTAALIGIAITAAATYTGKLAMEYDRELERVATAKDEFAGLEAQRASMLMEIEEIAAYRLDLLEDLRSKVMRDVLNGINEGAFDELVKQRANALYGKPETKAPNDVDA